MLIINKNNKKIIVIFLFLAVVLICNSIYTVLIKKYSPEEIYLDDKEISKTHSPRPRFDSIAQYSDLIRESNIKGQFWTIFSKYYIYLINKYDISFITIDDNIQEYEDKSPEYIYENIYKLNYKLISNVDKRISLKDFLDNAVKDTPYMWRYIKEYHTILITPKRFDELLKKKYNCNNPPVNNLKDSVKLSEIPAYIQTRSQPRIKFSYYIGYNQVIFKSKELWQKCVDFYSDTDIIKTKINVKNVSNLVDFFLVLSKEYGGIECSFNPGFDENGLYYRIRSTSYINLRSHVKEKKYKFFEYYPLRSYEYQSFFHESYTFHNILDNIRLWTCVSLVNTYEFLKNVF